MLGGCSSAGSPAAAPAASDPAGGYSAPRAVPDGMGSGQPDGQFPRTVAHFQGESTVDAEPQRVVVISTGQADALLALGIVPAGSTRGDGADLVPGYLAKAYPEDRGALAAVADAGARTEPNYEAIATIAPDLILMNAAGKDSEQTYARLSALAPTVVTQGTGVNWKQDFLLVADAVGRTQQAQRILDTFHADAAALGDSLPDAPTVSFPRQNGDRLRVFGVPSFSGSIAEDAHLARPQSQQFAETSRDISAEELDAADADWIFYGVQAGGGANAKTSPLTSLPLWSTLGAVQGGQAVAVDDDVFYLNTGPTAAREVLTVLQETLRP